MQNSLLKWLFAIPTGILAALKLNLPFIVIAIVFIILDCISAYRLNRRVKKNTSKASGKFKSDKGWKAFLTVVSSMVAIVLAWVIQTKILVMYDNLYLPNWTAAVICFIQGWSILENEASCNGSKWAIIAQKIIVDKTERHFDVDLSVLKDDISNEEKEVRNERAATNN